MPRRSSIRWSRMLRRRSKSLFTYFYPRAIKLKSIKEHSENDLLEFKEVQKRRYEEALDQKRQEIEQAD